MKNKVILSGLLIAAFCVTGCHKPAPNRVTIDDVIYKTGFYSEDLLYPNNIFRPEEEPIYQEGEYDFWRLDGYEYPYVICNNRNALSFFPTVYCEAGDYINAYDYYNNAYENYTYRIGRQYEDYSEITIADTNYYDAMEYVIKVSHRITKVSTITVEVEFGDGLICYRISNDNLFKTHQYELQQYNKKIYVVNYYSGDQVSLYDLGDYGAQLYHLYKTYGFIE